MFSVDLCTVCGKSKFISFLLVFNKLPEGRITKCVNNPCKMAKRLFLRENGSRNVHSIYKALTKEAKS